MPKRKPAMSTFLWEHDYPEWLRDHPGLIRFIYAWKLISLQRNQIARKIMQTELARLREPAHILDAGCGEGMHIFQFAGKFPGFRFTGIDKNKNHIEFCTRLSEKLGILNTNFQHLSVENLKLPDQIDLVLCIGTLQYIPEDTLALSAIFSSLRPQGRFFLYVPINGKTILPPYRSMMKQNDHYEKKQRRQRIYLEKEILSKLEKAGFALEERSYTYGVPGILAHELYSMLLIGFTLTGWRKIPAWFLFFLSLPIIFLLNAIDRLLPKQNGNGLCILAIKNTAS